MEILDNVELAPLTTFKVGGAARHFISVQKKEEVSAALDYAETHTIPYFILAGGSNTVISEEGFDGVVIKIDFKKQELRVSEGKVYAEAGCSLMETIHAAASAGLGGVELMYGIPGTVGGAVRGNAGAFGTEIGDVVKEVSALNLKTREVKKFSNEECVFEYRASYFKRNPEWVVLTVTFSLERNDQGDPLVKAEETLALRNERQIQDIQSAGSFFMNPKVQEELQQVFKDEKKTPAREGRVPAGWLIDKAGFRGVCEDGVCSGERSANYLINDGTANATSIQAFANKIKAKVFADFGVELQEEVTQVGF